MELRGKTVLFFGDSITEGALLTDHHNSFGAVIAQKTGATVYTNSLCGTRIARQFADGEREKYSDFCGRAAREDRPADVVAIFGGTNDFGHGDAPIGDPADRTVYTFWGALHILFDTLHEKYPAAKIVVVTPLHRLDEQNPRGENGQKPTEVGTLSDYVEIMRKAAVEYGFPVLDLFAEAGLLPTDPPENDPFFFDGLHPREAGHAYLADRMIEFFARL